MRTINDYIGNPVEVGDYVFYNDLSNNGDRLLCEVVGISGRRLLLQTKISDSEPPFIAVEDFVKIHPDYLQVYTMEKLSE